MSSNVRPDDHRRKWDRDEYSKLAKERYSKDGEKPSGKPGSPVKRELLKARDFKVDLTSKIGKSQIISKTSESSQLGGYYCEVCECLVKDSVSFLDHINGKNHQRNLGMSMKVERSTLDQVKKRFEMHKQKKNEKGEKATKPYSLEERVNELKEKEERQKAYKRERRAKKREAPSDDEQDKDDDVSNLMGFASFGSKKLKC